MIKKCLLLLGVAVSVMFAGQLHVDASETSVSSWSQLEKAVADANVDKINVTSDLTSRSPISVTSNKTIDFQQHRMDFTQNAFTVGANVTLNLSNFTFSGYAGRYIASGSGTSKIVFSGVINVDSRNFAALANLKDGSVEMDGVNFTYSSSGNPYDLIIAKDLVVTNKSIVDVNAGKFYTTSVNGSTVKINGGSEVSVDSKIDSTVTTEGGPFNITGQTDFTVDGEDTKLKLTGESLSRLDADGIFYLKAPNSSINILNGATMDIHSAYSTALLLQSRGSVVNVKDHSALKLSQDDDLGQSQHATLRFKLEGDMTFNVENHSKIDIEKKSGDGPAVLMYGSGNTINVKEDSDFVVHNVGDGTPSSTGSSDNAAIQFQGDNSAFNLSGEDSNVSIVADSGAGISAGSYSLAVDAGADTYFVIRGNTKTGGVIDSLGTIQMNMGTMKYYDFVNNGDGEVFSGGQSSTFKTESTNLSMWKKGSNLNGGADQSWQSVSYSLSGNLLDTLGNTSDDSMRQSYGKTSDYRRMNGNNQDPIIKTLFVPTNADKHLFACALMPAGKGEDLRPAIDGEVTATVGIYDENGQEVDQETANSKASGDMYGTTESGLITFDSPNQDFLKKGWSAKVLSGGRTGHTVSSATIEASPVTVQDVTPPNPAKTDKTTLGTLDKTISGQVDGEGICYVFVFLNGKNTGYAYLTDAEGKFTVDVPANLQVGDKVQLLLQNLDGAVVGVLDPPATNDTIGNIQPNEDTKYHDAIFKAGTVLEVTHRGELAWAGKFTQIDFGSHGLTSGDKKFAAIENTTGEMAVSDTRGTGSSWRVTASMAKELTSTDGSYTLNNSVLFKNGGNSQPLTNEESVIMDHTTTSDDETVKINQNWNDKDTGLFLEIPGTKHPIAGSYSGEINWSLQDVPGNN